MAMPPPPLPAMSSSPMAMPAMSSAPMAMPPMSSAPMAMQSMPLAPPKAKPTFDQLISGQDSLGFWTVESGTKLITFIENIELLQSYLNSNKDIEAVIITLLALFLLDTNF